MFSPEKSPWSGRLLTPVRNQNRSGASNPRNVEMGGDKRKGLTFPSSPRNFSAGKYANMDKDTLCDKISKLQNELFEYQYNMGLLLIEKKDWTSKYEELIQALAEADEAYKREKTAHLSALSEVEKREENLRKALGIEKQCVNDLEKALREMLSKHAEIKFTADSKLAEAKALVASVEEKSLEVEAKLFAVDARLAEVNRKTAEIERKSEDLVAQENALRRSRSSFTSEREAHETSIFNQKEDLREWEQKLHEGEERLADARSLLNQREQRLNENDKNLKQKEKELEDAHKKIDAYKSALNKEEEDMSNRLLTLGSLIRESDSKRKRLEMKELQLKELEEKLNSREKVEMQKLLDEHKAILEAKEKDFELEIEQKTKSMEEDWKSKVVDLEKKEAELKHMEEKIRKREQAIEKKSDKVKDRENELELKSRALKDREKSLKIEVKNMENERKQSCDEIEKSLALKTEHETIRSDIEKEKSKIREEREQLEVTEEERSEYVRLQLELKQEIDKYNLQTEQLVKESENLKHERLRFEKEWEELDDRRAKVNEEFAGLRVKKEHFEKLKLSEEEKLNNEKLQTKTYLQEELDSLNMAKVSFEANIVHENSVLAEKRQNEERKLFHDFELRKREFDNEISRKHEEMDNNQREKEKRFEEERENELKNINYLREVAYKEIEEMKAEHIAIEKEKNEISTNKQQLEAQQVEIREDIDKLVDFSQKLKDQKEVFVKEKERFCMFVENLKSCVSCEEFIHEFELSDLPSLMDTVLLKGPARDNSERIKIEISPTFGSPTTSETVKMSWLRKYTMKICRFSPGKNYQTDGVHNTMMANNVDLTGGGNEQELSFSIIADDSLDAQVSHSDFNIIREIENIKHQSDDDQRSHLSNANACQRKPAKKGKSKNNRKSNPKEVVVDHQFRSGEDIVADNGNAKDLGNDIEESRGESGVPRNMKKRSRAHASQETSEHDGGGELSGHSDSLASQRKRRQRNVQMPLVSGENRYNLRRPRAAAAAMKNLPSGPTYNNKEKDVNGYRNLGEEENSNLNVPYSNTADIGDSLKMIHDSVTSVGGDGGGGGCDIAKENIVPSDDFLADSPVRYNNGGLDTEKGGSLGISGQLVYDTYTSDEVNVGNTPKRAKHETEEEEEDEDDEEEAEHLVEASVGKKLWNFLTT